MEYGIILFSIGWALISSAWAMLALPWALSQLGWFFGPITLVIFSSITYYTTHLLSICRGDKNNNYSDVVKEHLGSSKLKVFTFLKHANRVAAAIGMNLTASTVIRSVTRYHCLHMSGANGNDACQNNTNFFMVLFSCFEIILSQFSEFEKIWWFSSFAAIMSLTYSIIAVTLGLSKVAENRVIKGSLSGVDISMPQKTWTTFTALGNVAFGFSYYQTLVEIKEKMASPPLESSRINMAALISVILTTTFYMLCGCVGYAAFGEHTTENLLMEFDFGFHNHSWPLNIASFAMFIHLLGAFQVFAQPIFLVVEGIVVQRFPSSNFVNKDFNISIHDMVTPFKINLFRVVWRSSFVIITTVVSMLLPFFNDIIGFIGAVSFFPLIVYFPIEIYINQKRIPRLSRTWICLNMLNGICMLISSVAAVASLGGVVSDISE